MPTLTPVGSIGRRRKFPSDSQIGLQYRLRLWVAVCDVQQRRATVVAASLQFSPTVPGICKY